MDFLRDGDELVFLYQLVEGVTNSSYACYIASQAELPADIVTRGKEVPCQLLLTCRMFNPLSNV